RAMVWRMRVILTRSSRLSPFADGAESDAGAGEGAGAASETDGAGLSCLALAAARTSSLVRRPSLPVPFICEGSRPCSSTARRTAGESVVAPSSLTVAAGAGAGAFWSAGCASSRGVTCVVSPAAELSSMSAITAPTSTVSPTATFCSPITPATGAGTSIATLSVSRLAMGSSSFTGSPGFLSHSPIVASLTDSPSVGTFTSLAITTHPQQSPSDSVRSRLQSQRLRHQRFLLLLVPAGEAGGRRGSRFATGVGGPHAPVTSLGQRRFDLAFDKKPGSVIARFFLAPHDILKVGHGLQSHSQRLAGKR